MNAEVPLVDFAPTLRLALLALVAALLPLSWVWLRQRSGDLRTRLAALTAVTLFLTFDLIVFGSFTRLTDSGLGCPDWPGCYGEASPLGARDDIHAAQTALPDGPVTFTKAWIEMIHRYLAMTVGVLILVMCASSWRQWQRGSIGAVAGSGAQGAPAQALSMGGAAGPGAPSPWWATATLVWVLVQGLFGKYTVTLKLYPAVVTAHLLGGMLLLALLVVQHETWRGRSIRLPAGLKRALWAVTALLWVQIALGGWVSTNYAVLACSGFPQCNGQWWPQMDFASGFTVLRELGRSGSGGFIPMPALVAIHMVHRLVALVLLAALLALAWALWRRAATAAAANDRAGAAAGGGAGAGAAAGAGSGAVAGGGSGARAGADDARAIRRYALWLLALALAQVASGLSNVVLGWPIAAALAHSAGAAALVAVTTSLIARAWGGSAARAAS